MEGWHHLGPSDHSFPRCSGRHRGSVRLFVWLAGCVSAGRVWRLEIVRARRNDVMVVAEIMTSHLLGDVVVIIIIIIIIIVVVQFVGTD